MGASGDEAELRALTLHQPWASLVAGGYKRIETRRWRPPPAVIGSRIAIHAGKFQAVVSGNLALAVVDCLGPDWQQELPVGAIVATAEIRAVRNIKNLKDVPAGREALFGDYTPGRWAWHLDNIRTLPIPMPARGYQGLWPWKNRSDSV